MKILFLFLINYGGESGIRTHVTLSSKHAFQACAFSHSAISPANVLRWEAGWEVGGWRDRRASRTSFSILWMSPQNRNLIRLAKPNLARAPNRVPVSDKRRTSFRSAGEQRSAAHTHEGPPEFRRVCSGMRFARPAKRRHSRVRSMRLLRLSSRLRPRGDSGNTVPTRGGRRRRACRKPCADNS